ncbi:MFS transporter [Brenneria tiliae]|uniref:MFS transporter n=1 Tax=Brenneria tiliae TaxID=2914984 RepID=UPI002014A03F|nr:MFS transporter [Brenneria tiliae]MCL2898348.1 MFS transporter [Brenneria tiliae]MCL2902698.1 MFS transporter [Brenneria tiliae]
MTTLSSSAQNAPPPLSPSTRRVAWIVSAVFFIEQLDSSIVAPALPDMAVSLGSDVITLSATITAYLLGLTVLIPVSGKLAERFGDKSLFSLAIVAFMLVSVACGFAQNAQVLIVLRFIQGLAGALMAPVGRLIVLRAAAKHELVEAMALVILLAMIAPVIGPFLGGVIVTWLDWRWIFWVNVPLCLLSLALIWRFLPATAGDPAVTLDKTGSVLTGLGFTCLVYGLIALGEVRHDPFSASAAIAAGVLFIIVYRFHTRRVASPVLTLSLLKLYSFRASMLSGSVFRIAVGGLPFLLPVTLQQGHGYSPLHAGMVVLIPAAGGLGMKFFSTRLLRKLGYRNGLALHGVFAGVCLALAGILDPRDAVIIYVLALFGFGWARSLQMNAYGTLAYADVEKSRLPAATSFFLSIQNLTTALGVALAALLLHIFTGLPGISILDSLLWTYLLLALLAVASAVMSLRMPSSVGITLLAKSKN